MTNTIDSLTSRLSLMLTIRQLYDDGNFTLEESEKLWKMKNGDEEMINLANSIVDAKIAELDKPRNNYGIIGFKKKLSQNEKIRNNQ